MYQYKVLKDYSSDEWDFDLVKGDTVVELDFPEPDIPAYLIGRGVLAPYDEKKESSRLGKKSKSSTSK